MKKLVALLMALVLALSCTAAFAEEAAAATGTMTGLSVALDENYVKAMAGAMDPDGSLGYAQAADAILQVLDNLGIYVVEEGDLAHVSVELNETVIANLTAAADDTGVSVVSSLFPHYAIRAEGVSFSDLTNPTYTINGQTVSAEEITAAVQQFTATATPYWEDVQTVTTQITPVVNEDGSQTAALTTKHIAAILTAWGTRLSADTTMQTYLQMFLEAYNDGQPAEEQLTLPALMQSLQSAIKELNNEEEVQVTDATVYVDEATGEQLFIVTVMESLYLQMDVYVNENNHQCVDFLVMTDSSESGEAESWEDIYNAITSGENTEDLLLGATIEITDSETVDAQLYAYVDGEKWQLAFGVTGATENYKNYAYLTVDPGMGLENGLFALDMASIDLDSSLESMGITMPSLDGLTVLDASTMGEDEANLLLADLQNYGLATLITNAQTAMPEQVALLLTLLTSAQE